MNELEKSAESGSNSRHRIFDRANVFILFLLQVLTGGSCGHIVRFLQGANLARNGTRISSSSSAYCQGRIRLELPLVKKVSGRLAGNLCSFAAETWCGLKVFVADGTGIDMPDTPKNRKAYPPRREQVSGTGVPYLNLVAVFELFSGGAVDWEKGNKHRGEQSLWKKLMNRICMTGTLILGDAYYCSYGNIATVLRKGGPGLFPSSRNLNLRKLEKIGWNEWRVILRKPAVRAKTWTKNQWKQFPEYLELRLIERTFEQPGFKSRKYRFLTTLTGHKTYPADEVVMLQKRRWDAELRLRDIKTAMGMNHLSCKTPAMITKEIFMFMTAYNLVRSMMAEAASSCGVPTSRISFKSACSLIEEWMRLVLLRKPNISKKKVNTALLEMIAENINPEKPGRSEPIVVKRTEQRFPRMKQPRKSYPEHRIAA